MKAELTPLKRTEYPFLAVQTFGKEVDLEDIDLASVGIIRRVEIDDEDDPGGKVFREHYTPLFTGDKGYLVEYRQHYWRLPRGYTLTLVQD